MRTIYVGGPAKRKSGGWKWKVYTFLFLFFAVAGTALKFSAPTIVEKWINKNGAGKNGYAYSIRDVDLSLSKGQIILKDVKVFNPKTSTKLLESPELTVNFDWRDIVVSDAKNVSIAADKVDLILSKDLTSEVARIKSADEKKDIYLDSVQGKIAKLNIVEQKEDQSRTVLELNNVDLKVKEVALQSINKKTEFSVSSNVADGGKLNLSGKAGEENGENPWSIKGSLKQVSSDIFNKIAGDKLPFAFYEHSLNAEISAHSNNGKVSGEISPDIKHLEIVEERAGIPTQSIKRVLTDELTFSLPFTLKDDVTVEYADIFRKLKNYRRSPAAATGPDTSASVQVKAPEKKKSSSFWPF
ncbi:MAG: hypothetical protein ACJ76H_01485 [Bacteriovoracaceae bacterium]